MKQLMVLKVQGPKMWNDIPSLIRNISSPNMFIKKPK